MTGRLNWSQINSWNRTVDVLESWIYTWELLNYTADLRGRKIKSEVEKLQSSSRSSCTFSRHPHLSFTTCSHFSSFSSHSILPPLFCNYPRQFPPPSFSLLFSWPPVTLSFVTRTCLILSPSSSHSLLLDTLLRLRSSAPPLVWKGWHIANIALHPS